MAMLHIESSVHWVDVTIEVQQMAIHRRMRQVIVQQARCIRFTNRVCCNTEDYHGELTLATMDTSDRYLISVDGWVDSEHRLHIVIDGNSPELLVEVQELDQETMEVLQEYLLTPDLFTNDMDLYISVGPGLHLIEFYHANESVLEDQNWSNDLPALEYDMSITKVTTEIGEEPWFAPSDEAKFWALPFDGFLALA